MSKYIDISVAVSPDIPVWPGSPAIEFKRSLDIDRGDIANDTTVKFSVHTGTHVDAPLHFVQKGKSVEQLSLDILIGAAIVINLSEEVEAITSQDLENADIPPNTERLLIRTRNSQYWERGIKEFQPDFVALTRDAAEWVVHRGIKLIGVDYLSVQRFCDGPETHLTLLESEVVIIEGLNLANVSDGEYQLICLPMKLAGLEGSPARVILEIK